MNIVMAELLARIVKRKCDMKLSAIYFYNTVSLCKVSNIILLLRSVPG